MSAKFPRGGGSRTFFSSKSICFRWLALLYLSPTLSSAGVLASLHPNSKVGSHEELARSCRWAMSLNHSQFDKTDKKCFIFS